jgi:hypothetical protein
MTNRSIFMRFCSSRFRSFSARGTNLPPLKNFGCRRFGQFDFIFVREQSMKIWEVEIAIEDKEARF